MGTALTDAQVDAIARLAPKALFCQDPDRAGQESVARGIAALRGAQRGTRRRARSSSGSSGCPPKQDPADVVQHVGRRGDARAARAGGRRSSASRSSARWSSPGASTDEMLAAAAPDDRPDAAPACCAHELVRARRGPAGARRAAGQRGAARAGAAARTGRRTTVASDGGRGRGGGRPRADRPRRSRQERPARRLTARGRGPRPLPGPTAPPEPADPRTALARREQSERAFLAYCLALPEEGERRLADVDIEDYFSAPATRQAAAYLRGRLRAPAASLPAGDEALARLVAELVDPRGRARGDARQARARGPPARPAPPRTPHLQRPHLGRHQRRRRARRRAPAGARRDPPPPDLSALFRPTYELVFVSSWTAKRSPAQLAEGRSIESIAREAGRAAVDGRATGSTSTG